MNKRKAWNLTGIIAAVVFLVSWILGRSLGLITFKSAGIEYFALFVVILSAFISWRGLKGKPVGRSPTLAREFYNSGYALSKSGDLNNASSHLKMAINMDPDFSPAYNVLGHVLYFKGKLKQSVQCYKRVIELEPDNTGAKESLELVMQALKKQTLVGDVYSNERYGFSIRCPGNVR